MFNFLKSLRSTLGLGRERQLQKVLGSDNTGNPDILDIASPKTSIDIDVISTAAGYNKSLIDISGDLGGIFSEVDNIESFLTKNISLAESELTKLDTSIQDIESKILQAKNLGFLSNVSYTNTIYESFTAQTLQEQNPIFYQNNTIPQAFVDHKDSLLKLSIDGEFNTDLSLNTPSNIFLDRCIGIPVGDGPLPQEAFDGKSVTYWEEILQSTAPIFSSQTQHPWLPIDTQNNLGYKGGAACRLRIELDNVTNISELDISPHSLFPINILSIGWTTGVENLLLDPAFKQTLTTTPGTYWSYNASGMDNTVGASAVIMSGYGLDNENCLYMYTTTTSGTVSAQHGAVNCPTSQGLEVTFYAKSSGKYPIQVSITYLTSGGSVIKESIESVFIDSLDWNKITLPFDYCLNSTSVILKFILPTFYKRLIDVYISSPKIEHIRNYVIYQTLNTRSTVFLPNPIEARNMYLVFSQENYSYKTYTTNSLDTILNSSWERLTRKIGIPEYITTWDVKPNKSQNKTRIKSSNLRDDNNGYINQITGTQWEILQEFQKYSNSLSDTINKSVYEYNIGISEIYLRHREYKSTSRFVSMPLKTGSEIREIRLFSNDSTSVPNGGNITYRITANENDAIEKSHIITNGAYYSQDISSYTPPVTSISYLTYTSWTPNTNNMVPIQWPIPPLISTPETSELVMVTVSGNVNQQTSIVNNISTTGLDLRGAVAICLDGFARVYTMDRGFSSFNFYFGISQDNISWDEQYFTLPYQTDWITDNQGKLLFQNLVFNISSLDPSRKSSVKYIRFRMDNTRLIRNTVYFAFRRITTQNGTQGSLAVKFIPADNINPYGFDSIGVNDFIVPVKYYNENYDGTDSSNRLVLNNYLYVNRNRILKLIYDPNNSANLSANTQNRRIAYDPNALFPKYLIDGSTIGTLSGYRPIAVTLTFNDGTIVYPDSIGKPTKGDIIYQQYELLNKGTINNSSQYLSDTTNTISTLVTNVSNTSYQTAFQIVNNPSGINLQVWWGTSDGSSKQQVDPSKVTIDSTGRYISIQTPQPSGYPNVYASYWCFIGENSPRENFRYPAVANTQYNISSGASGNLLPKTYPVTRNMTDFLSSSTPVLKEPNLDPLDPNYYPVYEYYVHPDGYLVFSTSLFKHGTTPAIINVEYSSLAISPRLIIDLTRPPYSEQTAWVDSYKLLINSRRN